MSRYASNLIHDRARHGSWPQGYWESVYGCMSEVDFEVSDDDLDPKLDDACDWFE